MNSFDYRNAGRLMRAAISFFSLIFVLMLSACSSHITGSSLLFSEKKVTKPAPAIGENYLPSGTIVISRTIPSSPYEVKVASAVESTGPLAGPVLGYIPPTLGFLPADNEMWLEVNVESKSVEVFKGNAKIKEL